MFKIVNLKKISGKKSSKPFFSMHHRLGWKKTYIINFPKVKSNLAFYQVGRWATTSYTAINGDITPVNALVNG